MPEDCFLVRAHSAASHVGDLCENTGHFRAHCKVSKGNWVNTGYIRKSPTGETEDTRVRLLNTMASRLKNRCLCSKMFVSPCSLSTAAILERDIPKPLQILSKLDCIGDTQGKEDYDNLLTPILISKCLL